MNITVFRIDDRLIHGQIVTAWLKHAQAKRIIVADDKVMKDSLHQSLLKMATPKGIALEILSIEDAIQFIETDEHDGNALLLVRNPESALRIVKALPQLNEINVGNINMKKGKTKILDNMWVDEKEVSDLYNLAELSELEVRAVPNDKKQSVKDLLDKII